ncbi:hypothetical protein KM043_010362 [Ampulex compressa]|nr:hypothetical protein KM043_010362 [Ampulex compressa]
MIIIETAQRTGKYEIDRLRKMADIKESPPLFDSNDAKIDDLDDDEDIFASAVQDQSQLEDTSPYNGISSVQAELPKLTLRDATEENSFSSVSSPVPGPLSPPLGPMSSDIGDLHDVPINDNADVLSPNVMQTQSLEASTETSDVYLKITVTSPQKIGDGMGAYVAYKVETKTNMPIFRKRSFSVIRRFSDFLGLHDKLTDKYLRNGRIIPPAPEKSVIGTTKIKMSGDKSQEQNSSSTEFIERRRAALERYLNRTAMHPMLSVDPDFREFLEADMELPKATNTSALSGKGVMRLFNKVGETVNKITYKMDETDTWFEEKTSQIDSLDIQLRALHSAVDTLTNQRRELATCTGATARSIAVLGHGEPGASLGRALAQLAETLEKVEVIRRAQSNSDLYQFGEMLRDYVALIGAIKDVFHERVKVFQNWQHAQMILNKKREQKARLEQSGRTDKTSQAATEVVEWEAKVDRGQEEFDNISKMIKKEVALFELVRVEDFKKQLTEYLEAMLQHQNQLIKYWESFLPEARARRIQYGVHRYIPYPRRSAEKHTIDIRMDVQTGLVYVAVVVISAAVILLVSMFGIKEKSYEEAIAEQRKLPDDLLLSKKDKGKEKKHKNKAGKKVKEKKEEKDEKNEKEEKAEHVQFEETPQILPPEPPVQKENLHQMSQSETVANKSPKDTPTKSKKNVKDGLKKKDENVKDEKKEEKKDEKKDTNANATVPAVLNKETAKEVKDPQKETPVKDVKEVVKETMSSTQLSNKEAKKSKKKNDILAQIGGDKDAVNVSLLMLFIQKAELSRSEIQVLIDQLLNKQLDNSLEHSEWTEGRADPVIKLKKQLAEKEKALTDEHEASIAFQNKLKELRAELNGEKSRLTASVRQLEEALNAKVTENQTLHTRMQHILESHAAEKQGFGRQIEQLQTKVSEDAAIIHKMQEDQGQTQGHLQQELISQRKQMEVQFAQMRENENALKTQLAQKHVEVQELQNELQATCESSTAEIEVLQQQLGLMQGQLMHSEGQLQHFKEAGDRYQDVVRQLEESHRAHADLDHRLKTAHRHEQELQKQVNSLQAELNVAKTEANDASALKSELNKTQSELVKLKSELCVSLNDAKEIIALKTALENTEDELTKSQDQLYSACTALEETTVDVSELEATLDSVRKELDVTKLESEKVQESLKLALEEVNKHQRQAQKVQEELVQTQNDLTIAHSQIKAANETTSELNALKIEVSRLQSHEKKSGETQLEITRLQEENDRLSMQLTSLVELQKVVKQLQEENESLASQLAANTERPAAEGRENGIDEKIRKTSVQLTEHADLLAQKESQLNALRLELTHKEVELNKLNEQIETLGGEINHERSLAGRMQNELKAQIINTNQATQKVKSEQEELTKAFLQRIFPEIKVSETSHDKWLSTFEDRVHSVLAELRKTKTIDSNPELEKQNKNLQGMVLHYKQIIDDTEGMLNKLQCHIESEETRWQTQLQQKESEVTHLRIELNELKGKLNTSEELQEKVSELEARLMDAESLKDEANAELSAFKAAHKSVVSGAIHSHELAVLEQLQEEKARLSEELLTESNKRATLDAEVTKLRSLVETSETSLSQEKSLVSQLQQEVSQLKNEICGGCSSSEQSMLNGPPSSDTPKSEGGSGKK